MEDAAERRRVRKKVVKGVDEVTRGRRRGRLRWAEEDTEMCDEYQKEIDRGGV